jgi:hypothetical protein
MFGEVREVFPREWEGPEAYPVRSARRVGRTGRTSTRGSAPWWVARKGPTRTPSSRRLRRHRGARSPGVRGRSTTDAKDNGTVQFTGGPDYSRTPSTRGHVLRSGRLSGGRCRIRPQARLANCGGGQTRTTAATTHAVGYTSWHNDTHGRKAGQGNQPRHRRGDPVRSPQVLACPIQPKQRGSCTKPWMSAVFETIVSSSRRRFRSQQKCWTPRYVKAVRRSAHSTR